MYARGLKQEAERKQLVTCKDGERRFFFQDFLENPEKLICCKKEKISLVSVPFGTLAHSSVVN